MPAASTPSLRLDFWDVGVLADHCVADLSRLSCASFESVVSAEAGLRGTHPVSWCLIKLYYSAFYAGHAILRLVGRGCSYFEKSQVDKIRQVATAYGVSLPFSARKGMHSARVHGCVLDITPLGSGAQGVHEVMWAQLGVTLRDVASAVSGSGLATIDSQTVIAELRGLETALSMGGAQWLYLTKYRNEVQYRHGRQSWFPASMRRRERDRMAKKIGLWMTDPLQVRVSQPLAEPDAFVNACSFLVGILRTLLLEMRRRSPTTPMFLDRDVLRLLRSCRTA